MNKVKQYLYNMIKDDIATLSLIFFAMLYITLKLTCNPLFFRQIEIHFWFIDYDLKIVSSALTYPLIYVISDLIVLISNRRYAIFVIFTGIVCSGVFSFAWHFISTVNIPKVMTSTELVKANAINIIGIDMWKLFCHGLLASTIASIAELLIFSALYTKIKNFFISTIISIIVTLTFHNTIIDYQMLKNEPDVWLLIIHSLSINITIMIIYALTVSIFLKIKSKLLITRLRTS